MRRLFTGDRCTWHVPTNRISYTSQVVIRVCAKGKLFIADEKNDPRVALLLLAYGANVRALDNAGRQALMLAEQEYDVHAEARSFFNLSRSSKHASFRPPIPSGYSHNDVCCVHYAFSLNRLPHSNNYAMFPFGVMLMCCAHQRTSYHRTCMLMSSHATRIIGD